MDLRKRRSEIYFEKFKYLMEQRDRELVRMKQIMTESAMEPEKQAKFWACWKRRDAYWNLGVDLASVVFAPADEGETDP